MRLKMRLLSAVTVMSGALLASLGMSSASAANTWAGVWNSSFGRMTLDAGGSGSYEGFNPGTVSGMVDGNVNGGTWTQPGNPTKSGTFKFILSADGLSFTGDWEYSTGGCGTACGWNGDCFSGPCKDNKASVPTAAVRRLQGDLGRLGLYSGPLDGRDSTELEAAVKTFQRRVGLHIDGDCDQRCRAALNKALGLDDPKLPPGAAPKAPRTVKELQRDLKKLGFYSGPLDGRNDAGLKGAVKRFQLDAGIAANGKCGARCQFAIVKALTRRASSRARLTARPKDATRPLRVPSW